MISHLPEQINSDANLVREVLDDLILKTTTSDMQSDIKNDISLVKLFKAGIVTSLMSVLTWPLPGSATEIMHKNL